MAQSLAERITSARANKSVRITDLEKLIPDAQAERERLSAASVAQSAESVDFSLSDADRDEAAARAERYSRTARGLDIAIAELSKLLDAKRDSEAQRAKQAEQASALAERDEVAQRITIEWAEIVAKAVSLFEAMNASDARMQAAGLHDPSAEGVARCAGKHFPIGITGLAKTRLPALDVGERAWPPIAPSGAL